MTEMERMQKEFEMMDRIVSLFNQIKDDTTFMAMVCTLFDIRFGEQSVEKAEACLHAMRGVNKELGAFSS